MADDDTGGTLHTFPGLRIPGAVADDPPPASGGFPTLAPMADLAPPASLSVADAPSLSGGSAADTATAHHEPGLAGDSESSRRGVGTMSVVMMAGITVAAMRGAYHVAAYLKARHDHHRAIANQQGAAAGKAGLELEKARIGNDAARQKARMQPGPEFGKSARNSAGSPGRSNSGKNSAPASLRSGATPNRPGGGGAKTPNKGAGGPAGGRQGGAGTPGQSRVSQARKEALSGSGEGAPRTGIRGLRTAVRAGAEAVPAADPAACGRQPGSGPPTASATAPHRSRAAPSPVPPAPAPAPVDPPARSPGPAGRARRRAPARSRRRRGRRAPARRRVPVRSPRRRGPRAPARRRAPARSPRRREPRAPAPSRGPVPVRDGPRWRRRSRRSPSAASTSAASA